MNQSTVNTHCIQFTDVKQYIRTKLYNVSQHLPHRHTQTSIKDLKNTLNYLSRPAYVSESLMVLRLRYPYQQHPLSKNTHYRYEPYHTCKKF